MSLVAESSWPGPARLRLVTTEPPAWHRVYDDLVNEIESGSTPIGGVLSSVSVLMARHGVSNGVVQRAFEELRRLGMVETQQGARTRLISKQPRGVDLRLSAVEQTTADLLQRVERLEQDAAEGDGS